MITQRADFQTSLEFWALDLLQSISHVGGEGLYEVGGHLDCAGQCRSVAGIPAEDRQTVVGLRV